MDRAAIEGQPDTRNARIWTRVDRAGLSYRNYGFWTSGTVPAWPSQVMSRPIDAR